MGTGNLSLGEKRLGHEADHSTPSTDKVKNEQNYTSSLPICLHVVDRNNFTFSLLPCTFYKFCSRHVLRKCVQHYKPFNIDVCRFTTMSQTKPSFTSATTYYSSEAKVCQWEIPSMVITEILPKVTKQRFFFCYCILFCSQK